MNSRPNPEKQVGGGRGRIETQQCNSHDVKYNVYYAAGTWNEEWVGDSGSFAGGVRLCSTQPLFWRRAGPALTSWPSTHRQRLE